MDQILTATHYLTEDALAFERERLFSRTWHCLGWRDDPWPSLAPPDDRTGAGEPLIEACGNLLFATGNPAPVPLADWLGPYGPWLETISAKATRPDDTVGQTVDCNWKFLIENTLDDCHSATVHSKTLQGSFAAFRSATTRHHGPHSDICYRLAAEDEAFWQKATRRFGLIPFGGEPIYRHVFLFPNLYVATFCDTMVLIHRIDPITPERSLFRWTLTVPRVGGTPTQARQHQALVQDLARKASQIIAEDRVICVKAQQGIRFAVHPILFGAREQRLVRFHQTMTAMAPWPDQA